MRLLAWLPFLLLAPLLLPSRTWEHSAPVWLPNLPDWFFGVVLGGTRWQWIVLAAMVALSGPLTFIFRRLLAKLFATRYAFFAEFKNEDSERAVRRSASILLASLLWWLVIPELQLEPVFLDRVRFCVNVAAVIGLMWLVYSLWDVVCDNLAERAAAMDKKAERLLVPVTRKLVRALILIGGLLIALAGFGVNVSGVIAGLGVGGLIIALAAKDSVENIFGSLTILLDMPFAIGDWVKIGSVDGVVEEINLRSTRIRTFEDSVITLPNSNLIKASVENLGARRYRRLKSLITITYDTPIDKVETFCEGIRGLIEANPKTRKDNYQVYFHELSESSLDILLYVYFEVDTYRDELEERSRLLTQIMQLAQKQGVQFAFPSRTVFVQGVDEGGAAAAAGAD